MKKSPPGRDFIFQILKDFPLLSTFPETLVTDIAENCEFIDLPENTQILTQGQMNEDLYFLVEGRVGVYVDGGRVSKMQRKGDLLGEMSVISNSPVAATLLSESPVTLLKVSSRVFLDVRGPNKDLYLSILYRIYATVLSEKLFTTNQKAKHFEDISIQLQAVKAELEEVNQTLEKKVEERTQKLEQQKTELIASKQKMEDLLNSKKVLFHRLSDLNTHYLSPLKKYLDDLRRQNPAEVTVNEARKVVFSIQQILGPLSAQYVTEQAVQGKRVLVVDTNKKQQVVARMALGGTGVILDFATEYKEACDKIEKDNYDLVIFDTANVELGNVVKNHNPHTDIVLMTSDNIPDYLPLVRRLSTVPYIVSRAEGDRFFTNKNILTTVTKLLSQNLFGLEKYINWGVDIQTRQITGSRARPQLISEVEGYLEKLGIRRANRDRIRVVVEEMLMNAIYDAPTDSEQKALYNHLPRTQELALKPEEQGQLRFATDGMLIAVSVQDPFGSLKGSTILNYLEHNYAGTAGDLNASQNKGGAGRGLHQIVENSDLVVFNVDPGKVTEVIALFNVEIKEKAHQNPSFHLFIKE